MEATNLRTFHGVGGMWTSGEEIQKMIYSSPCQCRVLYLSHASSGLKGALKLYVFKAQEAVLLWGTRTTSSLASPGLTGHPSFRSGPFRSATVIPDSGRGHRGANKWLKKYPTANLILLRQPRKCLSSPVWSPESWS